MNSEKKLELMIIIANRNGHTRKLIESISKYATFPSIVRSRGTAPNEIAAALGIGEPEKDLIMCFCEQDNIQKIYSILSEEYGFNKEKRLGIAMTVPVSAVGGNLTLQILLGKTKDLM